MYKLQLGRKQMETQPAKLDGISDFCNSNFLKFTEY